MAVTRKDLRDDEILRFLRFSVTESAAATFTEESYDTQLSIDRGLIWMIHWIEVDLTSPSCDDPAAAAHESVLVQISRESKSATLGLNDADLIYTGSVIWHRSAAIGTDAGPMATYEFSPYKYNYDPPLPFAAQNIYVGVEGSAAAAKTVKGRIGYTMRRVTDKFFYRVAQALIS